MSLMFPYKKGMLTTQGFRKIMYIPSPTLYFHLWSHLDFSLSSDGLYTESPFFLEPFHGAVIWTSIWLLLASLSNPHSLITHAYIHIPSVSPSQILTSVSNLSSHDTTTTTNHPLPAIEMECHKRSFNKNKNHPMQKLLLIDYESPTLLV